MRVIHSDAYYTYRVFLSSFLSSIILALSPISLRFRHAIIVSYASGFFLLNDQGTIEFRKLQLQISQFDFGHLKDGRILMLGIIEFLLILCYYKCLEVFK